MGFEAVLEEVRWLKNNDKCALHALLVLAMKETQQCDCDGGLQRGEQSAWEGVLVECGER